MSLLKEQRVAVSTLNSQELQSWVRNQKILLDMTQQRLLKHPHQKVLSALAGHPSLTVETAGELILMRKPRVLLELAKNKYLPPEVTRSLLELEDIEVSWMVGAYSKLEGELRSAVLSGRHGFAAQNGAAGRDDLSTLECVTLHEEGATQIKYRLLVDAKLGDEFLRVLLKGDIKFSLSTLIRNIHLPSWFLPSAAEAANAEERVEMLYRPGLPQEALETLSNDQNPRVLKALSNYPGLTENQMRKILETGGVAAANVALRQDCPEVFKRQAYHGDFGPVAAERVLESPFVSAQMLTERFPQSSLEARVAMASNPNLPLDLQKALVAKGEREVLLKLRFNRALVYFDELPAWMLPVTHSYHLLAEIFDIDLETFKIFQSSWNGTLGELILACRELGS